MHADSRECYVYFSATTVIIRGTGAIAFDNFAFKPDLDSIERMDSSKLFQNLVVLGKKELLNVSVLQLYKLE